MIDNAAIVLENVTKDYWLGKTQVNALKNVSIVVQKEDFLVIAGPSGSGKTTLLNIIGLIDKPTSGQVRIKANNITYKKLGSLCGYRRDNIGFIFQTFNLIPVLNVYENVEYPLILKNIPRKTRRVQVEHVLEKVGLSDRQKHKPKELSGGQLQRVSIARAIVKNPEIILADEPTANLDSSTGIEIVNLLEQINQNDGVTVVFSSHDPHIIDKGKRVVKLCDGQIKGIDIKEAN